MMRIPTSEYNRNSERAQKANLMQHINTKQTVEINQKALPTMQHK
jgi:hypothetical protein